MPWDTMSAGIRCPGYLHWDTLSFFSMGYDVGGCVGRDTESATGHIQQMISIIIELPCCGIIKFNFWVNGQFVRVSKPQISGIESFERLS